MELVQILNRHIGCIETNTMAYHYIEVGNLNRHIGCIETGDCSSCSDGYELEPTHRMY